MNCQKCDQETDGVYDFCDVGYDLSAFQVLSKRFHQNNAWAKDQGSRIELSGIFEQFANEIADPLQAEQQRLLVLGANSQEIVNLFEGERV